MRGEIEGLDTLCGVYCDEGHKGFATKNDRVRPGGSRRNSIPGLEYLRLLFDPLTPKRYDLYMT